MKFDHIEPEVVKAQQAETDAKEFEQKAVAAEYEAVRLEALTGIGRMHQASAKIARTAADAARTEADAFVADALDLGMDPKNVKEWRYESVVNLLGGIENTYVQEQRRRDVRRSIGMAVADADDVLSDREVVKDAVTMKMLNPLGSVKKDVAPTKRTNAKKSARSKSTTGDDVIE
jgi:hypothetical protein